MGVCLKYVNCWWLRIPLNMHATSFLGKQVVVQSGYVHLNLIDWLMFAYIALFSALLSRLTALACGSTWVTSFTARLNIFFIHRSGVLTAQVLCTPYNHAPCHFMQSHIRKVYACLAVTCHLHFWQSDRDLLRATAVTRGWNGYQNKSQHKKLTLQISFLSCRSCRDSNPRPSNHESGAVTTELSRSPW